MLLISIERHTSDLGGTSQSNGIEHTRLWG
jgi:hypothetical protein